MLSIAEKKIRKVKCNANWYKHNIKYQSIHTKKWREQFPYKAKLSNIRINAKQQNHKWAIPKEIDWVLISSPCTYCGQIQENFNGLDRINSAKGYTMDNVVPCCKHCNWAKNDMTIKEFENHINKIYHYKR